MSANIDANVLSSMINLDYFLAYDFLDESDLLMEGTAD